MRIALPLACLIAFATPLAARDLPPGLASARLLPGWTDADGNRVAALELRLEPGWKTYWRMPGDSGLPPRFDWEASSNLDQIAYHWPAPEAIRSGDALTMGYHDALVLPLTATPVDQDHPVDLKLTIDFGLCEKICVPAHLELTAPPVGTAPDAVIEAALTKEPQPVSNQPACRLTDIEDGVQVALTLPQSDVTAAALELDDAPDVWVSGTEIEGGHAHADFVGPTGAPFDLDTDKLRLTVLSPDGAVEMRGCAPQG